MKIKSYKDLNIWKGSIEVVEIVPSFLLKLLSFYDWDTLKARKLISY